MVPKDRLATLIKSAFGVSPRRSRGSVTYHDATPDKRRSDPFEMSKLQSCPGADFFRRVLICLWHKTSPLGRIATATNSLIKCGGKQALKRAVKQFYLPFFGVLTSSNRHILFDFCRLLSPIWRQCSSSSILPQNSSAIPVRSSC